MAYFYSILVFNAGIMESFSTSVIESNGTEGLVHFSYFTTDLEGFSPALCTLQIYLRN